MDVYDFLVAFLIAVVAFILGALVTIAVISIA